MLRLNFSYYCILSVRGNSINKQINTTHRLTLNGRISSCVGASETHNIQTLDHGKHLYDLRK